MKNSAGIDIDPGFTYEFINDSCLTDPSNNQLDRMLAEMSTVTTEHIASNGETIYLTRFGGTDAGDAGQCNYDQASFLAAYNPASDFNMANTAYVRWFLSPLSNKIAVGLDFQKNSDSSLLGVSNACHSGAQSPVQITGTSLLTLEIGFSEGYIWLEKINGAPGPAQAGISYPHTDSNYDECRGELFITKAASSNVLYLGTQSSVNYAYIDSYSNVGALGIYYKCVQTVGFTTADVPVEAAAG